MATAGFQSVLLPRQGDQMYPDSELVKRAMLNLRPRPGERTVRWDLVMRVFGLGSNYAKALCRIHGLDPDEELESDDMYPSE